MLFRISKIVHIQLRIIVPPPLMQILHLTLVFEGSFWVFCWIGFLVDAFELVEGLARFELGKAFLLLRHLHVDQIHVQNRIVIRVIRILESLFTTRNDQLRPPNLHNHPPLRTRAQTRIRKRLLPLTTAGPRYV